MKIIQSVGGPLVGLHHTAARRWGGAAERRFVGSDTGFNADYDAAGSAILNSRQPVNIATLKNSADTALLISVPLQTAVVSSDDRGVRIAQVHYAPEEWGLEQVSREQFEGAEFDEHASFVAISGPYVLFDAAFTFDDVGEEFLEFRLKGGRHTFSSALVTPPDGTMSLIYYKIICEDL